MSYVIGDSVSQKYFLVRGVKKFDWGIIGTLTNNDNGDIAFKFGKQDISGPEFDVGDILQVTGAVAEYSGAPQIVGRCMKVDPTPEVAAQLMPVTSVDVNREYTFMLEEINRISHDGLRKVAYTILQGYKERLLSIPAGMSMHHSCIGGWIEHTAGILRSALALQQAYVGRLNHDLLVAGAILHDIGKLYEFELSPLGLVKDYTFLGEGLGHAAIGVGMVMSRIQAMGYDPAEPIFAALLNIIGTHAGRREWGACAECITKEAVVIANLDFVDSHINAFDSTLTDVSYGCKAYSKSTRYNVYQTLE